MNAASYRTVFNDGVHISPELLPVLVAAKLAGAPKRFAGEHYETVDVQIRKLLNAGDLRLDLGMFFASACSEKKRGRAVDFVLVSFLVGIHDGQLDLYTRAMTVDAYQESLKGVKLGKVTDVTPEKRGE